MVFHSADQKLQGPFVATVDKVKESFHTGEVKGTKSRTGLMYQIPYDGGWHPTKPTKWAAAGIIEPDAAQALCFTSDYFAAGKSLEDVYVVMIGAGSAMGPFPKLLEMGATVVAIDIPGGWGKGGPRPTYTLWKRLCDTAKASPGALIFPLSKVCAASLLQQAPLFRVTAWRNCASCSCAAPVRVQDGAGHVRERRL